MVQTSPWTRNGSVGGGIKITSEEQIVGSHNNLVGKGVRSSMVFLRDEKGNFYQMEENQYMKMQLDEMQ